MKKYIVKYFVPGTIRKSAKSCWKNTDRREHFPPINVSNEWVFGRPTSGLCFPTFSAPDKAWCISTVRGFAPTYTELAARLEMKKPLADIKKGVREGTQSGLRFRLKGKGMPVLKSRQAGDMYVEVFVETPQNLTRRQREILSEFERLSAQQKPHESAYAA